MFESKFNPTPDGPGESPFLLLARQLDGLSKAMLEIESPFGEGELTGGRRLIPFSRVVSIFWLAAGSDHSPVPNIDHLYRCRSACSWIGNYGTPAELLSELAGYAVALYRLEVSRLNPWGTAVLDHLFDIIVTRSTHDEEAKPAAEVILYAIPGLTELLVDAAAEASGPLMEKVPIDLSDRPHFVTTQAIVSFLNSVHVLRSIASGDTQSGWQPYAP